MKNLKLGVLFVLCCSFACVNSLAAQDTDLANKKQILTRAHSSYYSLRGLGLNEFQASIQPNWELTLKKELQSNPEGAQNGLKMLRGLHFSMTLDPQGEVKVQHSSDAPPPNDEAAAGFQQIYSGMDQAVSGFFASWSLFMLTSPFPAVESEYRLEEVAGQYRLSYKDGSADVVTTMNKDLTITEIVVNSPQFKSTISPQFTKSPKGLMLSSYSGDYQPASGAGKVHLKILIDYQEVSGYQLPRKLDLDSTYDGTPTQMQLAFSNYSVKTKP